MTATMTTPPTSAELLLRIHRFRDPEAWGALVQRHGTALRATALGICADAGTADDAVQETLLHVRMVAGRFTGRGGDPEVEVRRWLQRMTANAALNLGRSAKRRLHHEQHQDAMGQPSHEPHDIVCHDEQRGLVRDLLASMPEAERRPLVLCYLLGLDHPAVGRELGCSAAAAQMRIARLLDKLRKRLSTAGFAVSLLALPQLLSGLCGAESSAPLPAEWTTLIASDREPLLPGSAVHGTPPAMSVAAIAGGMAAAALLACGLFWPGRGTTADTRPATTPAPSATASDQAPAQAATSGSAWRRACAWLSAQQADDGHWGDSPNATAITSLALIALPESPQSDRGRTYLATLAQQSGFVGPLMYHHGLATIALAHLHHRRPDATTSSALARMVDVICAAQSPAGGWRYQPLPRDADVSVTNLILTALAEARAAGVTVPDATIENGIAYLATCTNPQTADVGYTPLGIQEHADPLRSYARCSGAAHVYGRFGLGGRADPVLAHLHAERGLLESGDPDFALYGDFHAASAWRIADDERSRWWLDRITRRFLATQQADGSWPDAGHGQTLGPGYETAMHAAILRIIIDDAPPAVALPPRSLASR